MTCCQRGCSAGRMSCVPLGASNLKPDTPGRRRLRPGEAGLRRRLTPLAAGSCARVAWPYLYVLSCAPLACLLQRRPRSARSRAQLYEERVSRELLAERRRRPMARIDDRLGRIAVDE